jgi:hypothetical protein
MREKLTFDEAVKMFPQGGSGVHSYLLVCANIAAREKISEEECARVLRQEMTRPETHSSEVSDTVLTAYGNSGKNVNWTPKIMTPRERIENKDAIEKIKIQRFKRLAGEGCSIDELVKCSPVDPTTEPGYEPYMAARLLLYMYDRHEVIFCGDTYDTESGIDTVEVWAEQFLLLNEPPPFFIPNPLTGLYAETKSGKQSCRGDSNIADYRYALFEVDLPTVTLEEQAGFWMQYKEKLPVQAITYSGGKSLHALIRVNCENVMQWDKEIRNLAFVKWESFGADPACKNPARLSRLPGHKRDGKTLQKLLWLRGGAR